jgi:hypothetical protein
MVAGGGGAIRLVTVVALAIGCDKKPEQQPPPKPARPSVVSIPGRAPEPLVVYAAGTQLPSEKPEPLGMRYVAIGGDDIFFLDNRVHALLRLRGNALTEVASWRGEAGKLLVTPTHAYVGGLPQAVTELALADGKHRPLVSGIDTVQDFAVDATDVYVVTALTYGGGGSDGGDGKLHAFRHAGGPVIDRVLAEKLPGPTSIDVDATHVYFSGGDLVARIPKAGGPVETITKLDGHYGWRIKLHGDYVYVSIQETRVAIARVPKTGGTLERLATLNMQPASFAITDDALYLVAESDRAEIGTLWRIDLKTRELVAIATDLAGYPFVDADAKRVVWLNGTDAFVLPHGERTPQQIRPPK